jgi:hypothetical protein
MNRPALLTVKASEFAPTIPFRSHAPAHGRPVPPPRPERAATPGLVGSPPGFGRRFAGSGSSTQAERRIP